jgi:hypothetical protein
VTNVGRNPSIHIIGRPELPDQHSNRILETRSQLALAAIAALLAARASAAQSLQQTRNGFHMAVTPFATYFATAGGTVESSGEKLNGNVVHFGIGLTWP